MSNDTDTYVRSLMKRNYVCEVLLHGVVVTVLFVDRHSCTAEQAKAEFREQALTIKKTEGFPSLDLKMHL